MIDQKWYWAMWPDGSWIIVRLEIYDGEWIAWYSDDFATIDSFIHLRGPIPEPDNFSEVHIQQFSIEKV